MNGSGKPAIARYSPFAALIFYSISILLSPITLLGYVFWVGKLIVGRKSGLSGTAQGPLSARWLQHQLGIRHDEVANRLLLAHPGVSPLAVRLVFGPVLFAHRLTGYIPHTFRYPFAGTVTLQNQPGARQTFYDSVVQRYLPNITQFVILGAGFDTRAFRLSSPIRAQVRIFEVDMPRTSALKQALLRRIHADTTGVTFVSANFEVDNWLSRLVAEGFNRAKPALFLWEGVTPYLDRAAIEETLRTIAETATGSVIAFDYFTTEMLESQALYARFVRASLRASGEPLKFGVDSTPPSREHLAELIQSCGLHLSEQYTLGRETNGKRAWGGFAIAVVP